MSLLLTYHDEKRAVVCSDDRIIKFNECGEAVPMDARIPKFITVGALIFATVGPTETCATLSRGFERMLTDHPELSIAQLAEILPPGLRRAFARRQHDSNRPIANDNLEAAVLGYDHTAKRMRSYVFSATDDFTPVETTADPANRIFALGHYNPTDAPALDRLTARMHAADKKGLPWVASCLRDTVQEFNQKYPVNVGDPSFFAAIDTRGVVELPADFPPAPPTALEFAGAAHHVTTSKEVAFAGSTRFFLGSIKTPGAGAADTTGNNDGGTGAQDGKRSVLSFSLVPIWNSAVSQITNPVTIAGTGSSIANPQSAVDNDPTTSATLTSTGNGTTNSAQLAAAQAPGLGVGKYTSVVMNITRSVPTNSINGTGPVVYELSYTTNGGASFTVLETLAIGGGTLAKSVVSVSLPTTVNLSLCWFFITTSTTNNSSAGSIVAQIYDCNITVTE